VIEIEKDCLLAALNQNFHCGYNDGGFGANGKGVEAAESAQLIRNHLKFVNK
jgi:hypothetical protein